MKKYIAYILTLTILSMYIPVRASIPQPLAYIDEDPVKAHAVIRALYLREGGQKHGGEENNIIAGKVASLRDYLQAQYPLETRMQADDALTKFVGPDVSLDHQLYTPDDLVYLIPSTILSLASTSIRIRANIHQPLLDLAAAYAGRFGEPLQVNSGRRAYHQQQNLGSICNETGRCATPGSSEHQLGTAIDIGNMHGDRYTWMRIHGPRYGFHQSYQKGISIDGFRIEPWHRRYIGTTLAQHLASQNISFTQRQQHLSRHK